MEKKVFLDSHSLIRAVERGLQFGLSYYETNERILKTIKFGRSPSWKHLSRFNKTKCLYFQDNLSFYVIFTEKTRENFVQIDIRTIIIEEGRE